MSAAVFARMCESKRALGEDNIGTYRFSYAHSRCLACRGERGHWPEELELLTAADMVTVQHNEEDTMGKKGCELCGRTNVTLLTSRGKQSCTSCKTVMSALANRPEAILAAAETVGMKERLAELFGAAAEPDRHAVSREEGDRAEAWRAITKALGLDLDAVRPMETAREVAHTAALLEGSTCRVAEVEGALWSLENDLAAIARAAGLAANENPETVLKTINELVVELQEQREMLPVQGNTDELERQLHKAQERADRAEETVRELSEQEEILGNKYRGLQEELANAKRLLQEHQQARVNSTSTESALLNLALDAMRGTITGLTAERIEALRNV